MILVERELCLGAVEVRVRCERRLEALLRIGVFVATLLREARVVNRLRERLSGGVFLLLVRRHEHVGDGLAARLVPVARLVVPGELVERERVPGHLGEHGQVVVACRVFADVGRGLVSADPHVRGGCALPDLRPRVTPSRPRAASAEARSGLLRDDQDVDGPIQLGGARAAADGGDGVAASPDHAEVRHVPAGAHRPGQVGRERPRRREVLRERVVRRRAGPPQGRHDTVLGTVPGVVALQHRRGAAGTARRQGSGRAGRVDT